MMFGPCEAWFVLVDLWKYGIALGGGVSTRVGEW